MRAPLARSPAIAGFGRILAAPLSGWALGPDAPRVAAAEWLCLPRGGISPAPGHAPRSGARSRSAEEPGRGWPAPGAPGRSARGLGLAGAAALGEAGVGKGVEVREADAGGVVCAGGLVVAGALVTGAWVST